MEKTYVRTADQYLFAATRGIQSDFALRDYAHARARARTSKESRCGNCGRKISRTAARNSLGRQGSAGYGGNCDNLRRGAISKSRAKRGCRGGTEIKRSRRSIGRETQ